MASRYSFSLTTFSPSGKLVQIEYALKAVSRGTTSVGIKATNGIVIATEKKASSILVDDATLEKVAQITSTTGVVYSGMGPDARLLISSARKAAQVYRRIYKADPPTAILAKDIAAIMQDYTQSGGVRPFGVSLLVAGWDDAAGHTLYQVDPSGTYFAWKATAIGKNMVNAKNFLEKRFSESLELDDAVHTAILALKDDIEGPVTAENLEIGVISFAPLSSTAVAGGGLAAGAVPIASAGEKSMHFTKLTIPQKKDYLENLGLS